MYLLSTYHLSCICLLSSINHLSTTLSSIYLTSIYEYRDGKNADVHTQTSLLCYTILENSLFQAL